ncbi:MAG: hypothetical protein QM760_11080 [Nibricoccus sp.]
MNYNRRQLDEIARQLIRDGYFFYRHDFVWGFTPAFRNVRGTHFYFIANDQILTPRQMYTHLVKTWCPASAEEQMFFQNRLTAHFAALPAAVPSWHGLTPAEMLSSELFQQAGAMDGDQHAGAYAV